MNDTITELNHKFGYELKEKNDDCQYLKFERTVNGDETHVLIIEDHRWEKDAKILIQI